MRGSASRSGTTACEHLPVASPMGYSAKSRSGARSSLGVVGGAMPRASVGSGRRGVAALALVAVITAAARPIVAAAEVPSPTLEGPVTGGGKPFIASTTFDLALVGYGQGGYFISGTARALTSAAPLTSDGRWRGAPGGGAGLKKRGLRYRPPSPKECNAT